MDKCTDDISLPREVAVDTVLERCRFTPRSELIPAMESFGRILATDVRSLNTLPNALASNRDGIAFHFERFESNLHDTSMWREGVDYVFSNTGIGIQGDFDTVVLIEHVHFDDGGHLMLDQAPLAKGDNTIPVGNELRKGDLIAKKGDRLTPSLVARIAKGGHTFIEVLRPPVVSFLPTGNELVPPDTELPLRKNVDANSSLIRGKLAEAGAEAHIYPIIKDDPEALRENLTDAVAKSDIVLINAGSSKGTDDFSHEVLAALGEIINHQVDTGPGKHTSYTMVEGVPVVGLSGPTVCCDYTFDWYVRPLIERFFGRPDLQFPHVKARSAVPLRFTRRNVIFMMGAHLFSDGDGFVVLPAGNITDGCTIGQRVNSFVALHEGLDIKADEMVDVEFRYPFTFPSLETDTLSWATDTPFVF